jgi:ubiquinone/menaquinone biosynthesis C-methylase UbiE
MTCQPARREWRAEDHGSINVHASTVGPVIFVPTNGERGRSPVTTDRGNQRGIADTAEGEATMNEGNPVKSAVAAHWNRRAPTFDSDFGHSIVTADERAAWDRIFGLISGGRSGLDALDVGCGTGFLSFELAARGHRATGIDFAAAMLNEARRKTALTNVSVRFEQGDAENLPFIARVFDLVVCRHVLWTLPHPEAAVAEWVRVLRPGGRLVVLDSQFDENVLISPNQNARASSEYAGLERQLPFLGGRPPADIEALFEANGLVEIGHDPLADLVEAHYRRMEAEGLPPRRRRRYAAWGNAPGRHPE